MKYFLVFILALVTNLAWAQDENADVIVLHEADLGCTAVDADGNFWADDECDIHLNTHADGRINNCKLSGKLPEGGVLPKKAYRATIQELGFGTCCFSAGGNYILSPSGQYTYNCRD